MKTKVSKTFLYILFVFSFITCGFSRKIYTIDQTEPELLGDTKNSDDEKNMGNPGSKRQISETDLEVGEGNPIVRTEAPHSSKSLNETTKSSRNHQRKSKNRSKNREKENPWFYCSDESTPQEVTSTIYQKGVMCTREYPSYTCCPEHDLTVDLLGSKVADQISDNPCVHLLKKLRCAHCSPRSWWLFHAADKRRLPHKRVVPILCPSFCKKFHAACRDSITGLQNDDFCEFHTSNDAGPCFPDYQIRRGTID